VICESGTQRLFVAHGTLRTLLLVSLYRFAFLQQAQKEGDQLETSEESDIQQDVVSITLVQSGLATLQKSEEEKRTQKKSQSRLERLPRAVSAQDGGG
jgi:hypothetical protein